MREFVYSEVYSEKDACVQQAIAALREGELVVLPTETVYGIAVRADLPHAVERLMTIKQRFSRNPFTLAVPNFETIRRYVPNFSGIAERMARRCFPGPLTLVLDIGESGSEIRALPESVKPYVYPSGAIGVRIPQNPFTLAVLEHAGFPVVLTSANISGEMDSTSCDDVESSPLATLVSKIYDAGPCAFKKSSSVLRFNRDFTDYTVLREGAVSEELLRKMAQPLILFVDTADSCRAPMAKVLAKKALAEHFSLTVEELEPEMGISILSAGIFVYEPVLADGMALEAMSEMNLDLSEHIAQPVTEMLLRFADRIFCMTVDHCMNLLARNTDIASRLFLMNKAGGGIVKPEGDALMQYRACAKTIREALDKSLFSKEMENILR